MRWILALAMCVGAASAAASQNLALTAVKRPIGEGGLAWDVILTNHGDAIDVRHVRLNRGNCHATMGGQGGYPNPLRFGQRIVMRMFDCDPIEVAVDADQGGIVIEMPE